jgi:hypothetical protein
VAKRMTIEGIFDLEEKYPPLIGRPGVNFKESTGINKKVAFKSKIATKTYKKRKRVSS